MGFFEDDRVRGKNNVHNAAQQLQDNLEAEGLNSADIESHLSRLTLTEHNSFRNEVYSTVLRIVRSNRASYLKSSDSTGDRL
jgi:hypothetical protein